MDSETDMRIAAFFDLDKTIVKGNTGIKFMFFYFFRGKISVFAAIKILINYFLYKTGRRNPFLFFNNLYCFMKGLDYNKEKEYCSQFFRQQITIFPAAMDRIKYHKQKNHLVIILTNALDFTVSEIKSMVYPDIFLASSLETRKGLFTGEMMNIEYGLFKAKMIQTIAELNNIDLNNSFAYSDNYSDIPMLACVGNPVTINPKKKLARYAKEHGWVIKRWR